MHIRLKLEEEKKLNGSVKFHLNDAELENGSSHIKSDSSKSNSGDYIFKPNLHLGHFSAGGKTLISIFHGSHSDMKLQVKTGAQNKILLQFV